MKKLVLVIAVLLITVTSADAQRRRGGRGCHGETRTERIDRMDGQAKRVTDAMVSSFGLDEKQKANLLELNKTWIGQNNYRGSYGGGCWGEGSEGRHDDRGHEGHRNGDDCSYGEGHRHGDDCHDGNYSRNSESYQKNMATPTLYRELRINRMTRANKEYPNSYRDERIKRFNTELSDYKASLKKIMTSSQFKSYEKRVADEIADISKKY